MKKIGFLGLAVALVLQFSFSTAYAASAQQSVGNSLFKAVQSGNMEATKKYFSCRYDSYDKQNLKNALGSDDTKKIIIEVTESTKLKATVDVILVGKDAKKVCRNTPMVFENGKWLFECNHMYFPLKNCE